jgi:hypothetical protein
VAVFVADVLAPIDPADLAARLARALATYLSIGSIPSTVDAGLALARVGASTDPAAATALVAALCRRGGDAAEADAAGLIGDLRSRLGPGAFARASGSGATLDDDRLSRLGRDLANAVAAPKAVGAT